ncbi:Ryanodine receptor Ryr [Leucothrix pacifica]|uniref:Ryanodine receptor Ryr n=2 Tax=Leucothrix pacifica TaxID=1247513 RepID=A0A317CGD3_9GAMM|nr:Ryanodine receptor Ryr [Leucothrix pacifica]
MMVRKKDDNMYNPKPIDTSKVDLPDELEELLEKLAFNTHEVWSQQRMKDGWRYGDERNDKELLHPCLVPYDELPEAEKEYDRSTSREALKAIIAAGFKIVKD